jgi:hypothetical protein
MTELLQFLIVFDHQQGTLHQEVAVFTDVADALRDHDAPERHVAQ